MGGSSKKQTVGYKYYLGEHMILCHGPIDKLTRIAIDDRVIFSGSNEGTPIGISRPDLFGGEKREGGVSGTVDVEFGESTQGRNDYLQARLGASIPAFRGVVGIVLRQMYLGMSPYLKPWAFRCQRVNVRQNGLAQWYADKAPIFSRSFSQLNISFVLDGSGSMLDVVSGSTTRWDVQVEEINAALESFKSIDANLKIGISIFGLGDESENLFKTINSPSDIDQLKNFVSDYPIVVASDTNFTEGMQGAKDFFAFAGNGVNVVIFTTDGNPSNSEGDSAQQITTATVAVRDSIPGGVDVHVLNIDLGATTYSNQVDNTGGADVVSSTGNNEITNTALNAIGEFFEFNMNPIHIIRECLTDPDWGMGYQDADIDSVSFEAAADKLFSEGMGMSLLWSRQNTIEEFVQEVVKHIDASVYVDRKTGKFVVKLVRDDYEEASLPVFDESNISKVQGLSRASFGELVNSVTVNYWDAETGQTASLTVQDTALVQMQNATINTTIQYPGFTNAGIASRVAMRDLRALSSPLWSGTIYSGKDGESLNIGDVFKFSWSDYGIDSKIMRVTGLSFGNGKTNSTKIICTEDVYATPDEGSVSGPSPEDGWVPLNNTPEAADIRIVEETPYYELVTQFGQSEIDEKLTENPDLGYMFAAAGRPDAEGLLNATVLVDSGSGYEDQDTLDFSPHASTVDAVFPTQTTFAIENANDLDTIVLGTHAQLGDELVRVDAVSDTSVTVGRSVLDTVPKEHPSGTKIVFWDNFLASDEVEYVASESIDVKILPASGGGVLDEASAPVDSITFASRAILPYPPGNFKINTVPFEDVINEGAALSVSWSHRDRSQQTAGNFDDQTAGDIGPEAGTTYTLRIYGETDSLGRTETGIIATSYDYDIVDEQDDFQIVEESVPFNYAAYLSGSTGDAWLAQGVTHYQDNAATNPASVGTDLAVVSGINNSYNALQTNTSNRPALLETSGKKYFDFDGVDEYFEVEGGLSTWNYLHNSTGPDGYIVAAVRISPSNPNPSALEIIVSTNRLTSQEIGWACFYDDRSPADQRYRWLVGRSSSNAVYDDGVNGVLPAQIDAIVEIIRQGSGFKGYIDGVEVLSGTYSSPTDSNASNTMKIGAQANLGGIYTEMYLYGLMVTNKVPDTPTRNLILADMANRCINPPLPTGTGFRVNGRLRVELESVRDGYTSRQHYDHEILRDGYGFNYGLFYGGEA